MSDAVTDVPVAPAAKPPYSVPSMADIAGVRATNGFKVASTFSGCGGSCLGFEMAGFEVVYASEFVEEARATYVLNHPGVPVDDRDIREVSAEDVLERIGMGVGELDVLEGSPPCASFSTAGSRSRHWGQERTYSDTRQRTDDLFFEFARLLEGIKPKAFIAENVSGLVKGVAKGYFKDILARLQLCGYRVEARLLDAQWLGVPQMRQRIIFQGVRMDVGREPAFPTPLPYRYSIVDALPWLADATVVHDTSGLHSIGTVTNRPAPTILTPSAHMHVYGGDPIETDPETGARITLAGSAIAPAWDLLREGETSKRYFNLVRPDRNRPSPTVTMKAGGRGTAGVTHPIERRKFTLLELRRVCGFPDDFELTGTYHQRWERLGRAVPPPMMRAVAEQVRDRVLS